MHTQVDDRQETEQLNRTAREQEERKQRRAKSHACKQLFRIAQLSLRLSAEQYEALALSWDGRRAGPSSEQATSVRAARFRGPFTLAQAHGGDGPAERFHVSA